MALFIYTCGSAQPIISKIWVDSGHRPMFMPSYNSNQSLAHPLFLTFERSPSIVSILHLTSFFLSFFFSLSESEMTTTIILNSLLPPPPPQTHSPSGLTRYMTSFPLRYSTTISCNVQTVILPTFKTPQPHKKYSPFFSSSSSLFYILSKKTARLIFYVLISYGCLRLSAVTLIFY